jgi:hypothetical protein
MPCWNLIASACSIWGFTWLFVRHLFEGNRLPGESKLRGSELQKICPQSIATDDWLAAFGCKDRFAGVSSGVSWFCESLHGAAESCALVSAKQAVESRDFRGAAF